MKYIYARKRKYHGNHYAKVIQKAFRSRKKKPTLTKRVRRLESQIEKKFDVYLLSDVGETNLPNSQEMSNNLGSASTGYQKQIRDITPTIALGTQDNQRVGDEVCLKSMTFRAVCTYQANADLPAAGKIGKGDIAHCRVMLVWDNVPTYEGTTDPTTGVPVVNNNPLSWNHMLDQKPSISQKPNLSLAGKNHDIVDRDRRVSILFDKRFDMVAGTDRSVVRFSCTKKWVRQKLKYLLNGTKVLNRQLKLCFLSNRVSGECPLIYCESKSIYTDP